MTYLLTYLLIVTFEVRAGSACIGFYQRSEANASLAKRELQ